MFSSLSSHWAFSALLLPIVLSCYKWYLQLSFPFPIDLTSINSFGTLHIRLLLFSSSIRYNMRFYLKINCSWFYQSRILNMLPKDDVPLGSPFFNQIPIFVSGPNVCLVFIGFDTILDNLSISKPIGSEKSSSCIL